MTTAISANGVLSPPPTEKANSIAASPPRVVLAGPTGRILCIADIRGDYHELNRLIREHDATAVIHTGDFGFMTADSIERMGDKILRHLVQYSPLIPPATRSQLLSIPASAGRAKLVDQLNNSSIHFPLSQFPHLLTGAITFPVPVFTVWGLVEDVRVLEKFRTGEYEVNNLSIIDEATTRLLDVGGLKLRLFGLGGTVASHKLFDNGEGYATIAGGAGTMWSTALQMGELIDTAQRVFDPQETRLFISSAPISRNGVLPLIANALKADLTISGGLHFRYPVSFNEFSIHSDFESYSQKLSSSAQKGFVAVYDAVKDKVNNSLNDQQQALLKKILQVVQKIPQVEDGSWTNTWNWVLSDASCGHLLLSITDSRVSAETKTTGLNFAHRSSQGTGPSSGAVTTISAPAAPSLTRPDVPVYKHVTPTRAPIGPGGPPAKPNNPAANPGSMSNSFKAPADRAPAKIPAASSASSVPSAPAPASSSATPTPNNVPVKPPAQTRQARGQNSLAGQALAAVGAGKEKQTESKSTSTPSGPSKDREKPSVLPNRVAAATNGKVTPAGRASEKPEKPEKSDKPVKEEPKKEAAAPTANSAKVDGAAAPAHETETKGGEKPAHSREDSEDRPKRLSLYVKGIPIPTTDDELKGLFGDLASKITNVNIIRDHALKIQKDFAYVDFGAEEEMNEALKNHKDSIRDATVSVSISNPPARRFNEPFRGGRGRGSFRGGRGRGFGSIGGGRKEGESGSGSGGGEKKE